MRVKAPGESANRRQAVILNFNHMTIRFAICYFLLVVLWNSALSPTVFEILGFKSVNERTNQPINQPTKELTKQPTNNDGLQYLLVEIIV